MTDKITPSRKNGRPRGYIQDYRPQASTVRLLDAVLAVLKEYRRHWPLTCRQIFYRLVGAHDHAKTEAAYKGLCHHIANARRGGVIGFDAIRDDGVSTYGLDHYCGEDGFRARVREMAEAYTRDKLARQPLHIEVWCEAAGMLPQLHRVCEPYSIHAYSSGGFDSLTAKKSLANRICRIGKPTVILHLGDYDPSGQCMFDVVAEDVAAFVMADRPNGFVTVAFERVALTREQVDRYNLPTAPPKASDSRSKRWDGGTCQLEALPPDVIAEILVEAIERHIDLELLDDEAALEVYERINLTRLLPAPTAPPPLL